MDVSTGQPSEISSVLIDGLVRLGYRDALLERNYSFADWFSGQQERTLAAAAFGQTPVSYESACIAVAHANGLRELALVNAFRAFGAPILLEIDRDRVREWAVSRLEDRHTLVGTYFAEDIGRVVAERARDWEPASVLRAKNIGSYTWVEQLGLFSGLIPELESQIQEKLDPLLHETLSETRAAYLDSTGRAPSARDLFKLVFWALTAKVFHDRRTPGFINLEPDPDNVISSVAKHYGESAPRLLTKEARSAAVRSVWRELDFRNLSVEVLAHIWSRTLVDRSTRKRLGIHRTPRSIVKYIVERTPFPRIGDDRKIVFEPCSGSAAFLIGALNFLRQTIPLTSAQQRHKYFVGHLSGFEFDPFGVEISLLALTLADFPNPNGWDIVEADAFQPHAMSSHLSRAGVVFCNPPFERFSEHDRRRYGATEARKPAELLKRVLADLHPSGVLGFVLPYIAVDGREYAETRRRLAERYASIEFTVLPDKVFDDAETEVALLIAKDPIPHNTTSVSFRRVEDLACFQVSHSVASEYSKPFTASEASDALVVPDLSDVWAFLADHRTIGDIAEIHRGLEWTTPPAEGRHVTSRPTSGYQLGVPPKTRYGAFEVPAMRYLSVEPEKQRRNAWKYEWEKPKAIVNKARRSRGRWRLAAFADRDGVTCYQTFYGVWPRAARQYNEIALAAILNSPVANAFVASREGNRDVTAEVLKGVPVPVLSPEGTRHLLDLVERYEAALKRPFMEASGDLEMLLKQIDATIIDGYFMPPRLERALLDYFNGSKRPVSHEFGEYFPRDLDVFVSLSDYIDPRFRRATVGELVRMIDTR